MKPERKIPLFLLAVAVLGTAGYVVWNYASDQTSQAGKRKVLFYQDSMHPWIKSDRPGKCTVCVMDLTPIYEGEVAAQADADLLALSSNSISVLNVQSEEVRRQTLSRNLRVAGTLEANEARRAIVSAPAPGRIQSVAVDYAGIEVKEGQPLITLVSAELIQKRAWLRSANVRQVGHTNDPSSMGMNSDLYSSVLLAPHAGTIIERAVAPGQFVLEGEKLLTIVDPSVLWFRFDVYEGQLAWFKPGQNLDVVVSAVPGKVFPAVITFIEPTLNDATRTVKVRADIKNPVLTTNGHPERLLRFGMYAEGRVSAAGEPVLAVPRSAILFPGGAAYAYVDKGHGAYERRRVKLGRQGDDSWEVLSGLEEGDRVVTSGNVLIDAQAQFNRGDANDIDTDETTMAASENRINSAGSVCPAASDDAPSSGVSGDGLTPAGLKSLQEFLDAADGVSRALAADSLEQLRPSIGKLPEAACALTKAFKEDPSWQPILQRIEATSRWPAPADLAQARKAFLPFSTNVVALVQKLRVQEDSFGSLKVYFCPMAPKPGLWFQAKGPLRNPYYGAAMLMCGEEVRRPAVRVATGPKMAMAAPRTVKTSKMEVPAAVAKPSHSSDSEPATAAHMSEPTASEPESASRMTADRRGPNRLERAYSTWARSEEMRLKRWAAIVAANTPDPSATNQPAAKPPVTGVLYEELVRMPAAPPQTNDSAMPSPPPAQHFLSPGATHTSAHADQPDAEANQAAMPLSDEVRLASVGETNRVKPEPAGKFSASQRHELGEFLVVAAGISEALAADDLENLNKSLTKLPAVVASLQKELGTYGHWSKLVQRIAGLKWPAAKELAGARKQFLPFSTAVVDLVKQAKHDDRAFADLKVYHCPMAPKPGLWMQAKGPLRNPFYGAAMLTCGEEVAE